MQIIDKISIYKEYKLDDQSRCVVNIDFCDVTLETRNQIEKSVGDFIDFAANMIKENRQANIEKIRDIAQTQP